MKFRPNPFTPPAFEIALASNAQESSEPWLLAQQLSLDIPFISVAWQLLFAHAMHISVSIPTVLLTGLCVWMIYISDHLLDSRRGLLYSSRHRFVAGHARVLMMALTIAAGTAIYLTAFLPRPIFVGGIGLSLAVAVYLSIVHRGDRIKRLLPKEVMVAILFAAGSTIIVWTNAQDFRTAILSLLTFTLLCLANCVAVDNWEWDLEPERRHRPHWLIERLGQKRLEIICLVLASMVLLSGRTTWIEVAIVISALLLLTVSRSYRRFSADTSRLLADLCLLIPPVLLLLVQREWKLG